MGEPAPGAEFYRKSGTHNLISNVMALKKAHILLIKIIRIIDVEKI
ncbi:MAG: hypothetical protein Ct9H300mP28_26380 [Pseudomonadota bacterium]|nr:MAG: hypothetical protein Ct9H300mP28_26380 [Pseudomonadota bacterium]